MKQTSKRSPTTDAVEIVHRRYYKPIRNEWPL